VLEGGCVGACISWVADAIATDGDLGSIRIFFLGVDFTYNRSVGDFFASVLGYVIVLAAKKVSVPSTLFPVPSGPTPMPWHRWPSSLEAEGVQILESHGWRKSWR